MDFQRNGAAAIPFIAVHGVDFSGARLAGRNTWVARLEPRPRSCGPAYQLAALGRLEKLCGTAERAPALAFLVNQIAASDGALWALDFPFGLPIEVMARGARWAAQFDFLLDWGDDAYGAGVECVRRALRRGRAMHIRRLTDVEEKAPFDCYHYRIIYQTFFGMRDVLGPLRRARPTAILPFQYGRRATARRVLVEACPASTLKRLGLPHQNYKQPQGGPLISRRRRTRWAILDGLASHVLLQATHSRILMRDGGGDALDAI